MKYIKPLLLGTLLSSTLIFGTITHAAGIQQGSNNTSKSSLIEQNFYQKQRDSDHDNLRLKQVLNTSPSQSFFSAQNKKFTRFLQSLFS